MRRLLVLAVIAAASVLLAAPAQAQAKLVLSLTFDDGAANQMAAVPILEAHGMRATFYVISGRLGHKGYLSPAQVRALQAAGHEIGGHTASHADLTALDPATRQREICDDRAALVAHGLQVRSFAYPFGRQNAEVHQAVAACGYSSGRLVSGIAEPGRCKGCPAADTIAPENPFAVRAVKSIQDTTPLEEVKAQIDAARAPGGWLPLVFHQICDGCSPYGVSEAWFAELVDWIAAQPDIEVRTVGEVIEGAARPVARAASQARLVVSLTFDDGVANQMAAVPILEAHGMRATFYVNSGRLGHKRYLSLAQVRALQAAGHEIGGHTASHADLPAVDPATRQREICGDRAALLADGLRVRSFAYPFGRQNAEVQQAVAACGYSSGRLVSGIAGPGTCRGCPAADTIPPENPWGIRAVSSVEVTTPLEEVKAQIDAARATGGWLPLVFHHICDGCNKYGVSEAWFAELLAWIAAQPDIEVRTVGDVIGGPVKPVVAAQALTPVGRRQLLQNGSLSLLGADGVPRCFERGGTGTADARWRTVPGPAAGSVAQEVRIRSLRPRSDAKLVSRRDGGLCAPRVKGRTRYTVRARYRTNAEAHLIAYVRDRNGVWRFFAQSPAVRKTRRWASAVWVTPRLPRGATAISVGMSLRDVGRLGMARFALNAR